MSGKRARARNQAARRPAARAAYLRARNAGIRAAVAAQARLGAPSKNKQKYLRGTMMSLKLQDARIRRRQFQMKKELTQLKRLTVDSSLVRYGTPLIQDALLRNEMVMGLRIGTGTCIDLYTMWRDPMENKIDAANAHAGYDYQPHTGVRKWQYGNDTAQGDQTLADLDRGFDNRNHFKDGETVPKYLRVKLQLTNRVTHVDVEHLVNNHSMYRGTGGECMAPVATPVPVGDTLPAQYSLGYRVIVGKESDLTAANLYQPPATGFSQSYASFCVNLAGGAYNSGSSETFRYKSGTVGTISATMGRDIANRTIPEQGFLIRMSDRLFNRDGQILHQNERPTAHQPNVPLASSDISNPTAPPLNPAPDYAGVYNAITCHPISLFTEDLQLRAPRWMLPPFDGDVLHPATARANPAEYDRVHIINGKHYVPTGTTAGIHPGTAQKAASRTVSLHLLKNDNSVPLRSTRQYVARQEELLQGGKLSGFVGYRRMAPAYNAQEEAANENDGTFAVDPATASRKGVYPTLAHTSYNAPAYQSTTSNGTGASAFTYHNGITGNYCLPVIADTPVGPDAVKRRKVRFPHEGPMVLASYDKTEGGIVTTSYKPGESGFYLPANHRYVMFVIPYVVGPDGISHPLPPDVAQGITPYANISVSVTAVTEDSTDSHD